MSVLPKPTTDLDQTASPAGGWIDPGTLMRIRNLPLRARVVVEGFYSGLHRSPYHGISVEFSEYRQYYPGDDLRYLDWRLYARSDRYYIKRFEDETNLRCYVLLDMSRSMNYGSLGYTKLDYARTLAATLGYFLAQQRDAVGLLIFDQQVVDYLPPRYRAGHLHRLMVALERAASGKATDLIAPLEQVAMRVQKRGIVVLISDLLAPVDQLEVRLGYLRAHGHEVVVLRVLDPAELDFGFDVPAIFQDLESEREMYLDPAVARRIYERRFAEHEAVITEACRNSGIDYCRFTTDRPLELGLFDYLRARLRRGRTPRRRRL